MRTLTEILEAPEPNNDTEACLRFAMKCSPFLQRLLNSDADLLADIQQNMQEPMTQQQMRDLLAAQAITDEPGLKRALRRLRKLVMVRIISRDLNGLADLKEVMLTVSHLAEVAVQVALQHHTKWLEAQYGKPIGESGARQELIVVGMGKLGGYELNVSSDIDLIFAFEEDGSTDGERLLSNLEFFTRLGKKLIAAIDDVTEDGYVFRVDMRLRPYGSEGALACSFAMLEEYYQNQGREWERYAWIKGRVIAGPEQELADMLRPFVFRKYLDYGAFASMRDLKIQIQRDVNRRDMHDNIKLGRGGIREIEFIAQVFQLIRGGKDRSLQGRPTLQVLGLLKDKGLLPVSTVAELHAAYVFLRNLEHRLQYVEDAQTHDLPTTDEARARIALATGYADWASLLPVLEEHRAKVDKHFREVFSDPKDEEDAAAHSRETEIWLAEADEQQALQILQEIGYQDAGQTLRHIKSLYQGPRYKQLPELSRHRYDALMPVVIAQSARQPNPDATLLRVGDLLDGICRRASYLALLAEYPDALRFLIKLASASPWLIQYLGQHPILLDELLDTRNLYAEPDFAAMREDLRQRLADVEGDVERQMDIMRDFKHAYTFRFAVKDVIGELLLVKLSDYLSELADMILELTLETVWANLKSRHREQPKFAVIGYGKLGGKELGYASDLDIIFLYEDDAQEASEVYARYGIRIGNWLGSLTSAGILYETDLALRPDGASGMLVSDINAFREYQLQKAWLWEHQALTRARFCAGDKSIGSKFEQIRIEVMRQPRDIAKLKQEVVAMREKMLAAHPNHSEIFDLKHDRGGIIDVEFMVQYLVLAHAHQYAELTANSGNIALLMKLGELGLIDVKLASDVAAAYRQYRSLQHALKLQGESKARVDAATVAQHMEAVKSLWQKLFG
ncbi:MAG: bifunctional [glutamate--ammonia ligase]-adenylyl-L-tyrosine phosphorylase/[glutamate--ammonia-ligase] adenylyltransferase [Betaproteobacteria bacterium HGW-Betaproteobacteria-8]|nr:MAG: bifunctional [glutamate--ammonia ligase]-adenylyl-L-tyrosine phosphorylase/[glutamate--ammonia-ligase] adenylyltransferase [Betaproteobacteria bacterium HGW-Betaproteobacteria-8]